VTAPFGVVIARYEAILLLWVGKSITSVSTSDRCKIACLPACLPACLLQTGFVVPPRNDGSYMGLSMVDFRILEYKGGLMTDS